MFVCVRTYAYIVCVTCFQKGRGGRVRICACVSRKDGEGVRAYMHVCVGGRRGWDIDRAWRGDVPCSLSG